MSGEKVVDKNVKFSQVIDYAGHRSRSSAGEVSVCNPTLHRPFGNDSSVPNQYWSLAKRCGLARVRTKVSAVIGPTPKTLRRGARSGYFFSATARICTS